MSSIMDPQKVWSRANPATTWDPEQISYIGVRFLVRIIANGFILCCDTHGPGTVFVEYYCADLKDVGERVTACCIAQELKGNETSSPNGNTR